MIESPRSHNVLLKSYFSDVHGSFGAPGSSSSALQQRAWGGAGRLGTVVHVRRCLLQIKEVTIEQERGDSSEWYSNAGLDPACSQHSIHRTCSPTFFDR